MNIENITVGNTGGSSVSSLTISHDHTAGNFLVVFVGMRNLSIISVKYNGVDVPSMESVVSGTAIKKECFVLKNPADGPNNLVISSAIARRFSVFVVSLSDVGAVRDIVTNNDYIDSEPYEIEMDVPSEVGDIILTSYHWERSAANIEDAYIDETIEAEDDVNSEPSRGVLTSKSGLATETPTGVSFPDGADLFPASIAGIGISLTSTSVAEQHSFRFRNDDGNEANATWKEGLNTNTEMLAGENARIRFLIDNLNLQPRFEARLNNGSWRKVE